MVPVRKPEAKRFVQFQFEGIDKLTNLVIEKKLPAAQLALLVWMSSYGWDLTSGGRNPCMFSRSQLGEFFGVEKETIGKWLKKLEKLGLISVVYIVYYPKTNKRKRCKSSQHAYTSIQGECAQIEGIETEITCEWLRVKTTSTKATDPGVSDK